MNKRRIFFVLGILLGANVSLAAMDGTWQRLGAGQPSARYTSPVTSAVYAPTINSMVFFGGSGVNTFLDDAWKLDLSTLQWSPLTSATPGPPGRVAHAAVYDAAHDRMVIYGGFAANYTEFQDLWVYEFGNGRWVELSQGPTLPGDRGWAAALYNPKDTTMLLFGGQDLDGNFFNDIWILDLNSITWTQIPPGPGWPDTRITTSLVLDEQTNTAWMFGGFHRPGDFDFHELWSLDLTSFQWTLHPLGSPAPPARDAAAAFFDPASRSMVIFGGSDVAGGRALNDLWAYSINSQSWQALSTTGDIPAPRRACATVFLPAQNRFFLFGGLDYPDPTLFGDTYLLNLADSTWQRLGAGQPSARYTSPVTSAVYAPTTNSMVFFGGYDLNVFMGDGWKLDLANFQWSPLTSATPGPPGRVAHAAVYDAAHDRMVIYGGFAANYTEFQDLWVYEFGNGRWVELSQGPTLPGDRGWAAALYNPKDTTMLLFGGQDLDGNFFNDIWILDLNSITWTQIPPGPGWPDTRITTSLVLDEQTNTAWMFGGFHRPGDFDFHELWSLDLTTFQWTSHPLGSPAPPARDAAAAFFDPASRSMVIFGGSDVAGGRALNDLWAYSVNPQSWQALNTTGDIPAPRRACATVFLPAQNRFFLFGGLDYPDPTLFGDTYLLDLNPLPVCNAARGDMNADGSLTATDLVLLLNCAFLGIGGCDLCFSDVSCNGILNSVDVVVLLNAIFLGIPMDCSP